VENADRTGIGHGRGLPPPRRCRQRALAEQLPCEAADVLADLRTGLGQHERDAFVVGLYDEAPVGHDTVFGHAPEGPLEVLRIDATRRVGAIDPAVAL